jgi:hypothetical protein
MMESARHISWRDCIVNCKEFNDDKSRSLTIQCKPIRAFLLNQRFNFVQLKSQSKQKSILESQKQFLVTVQVLQPRLQLTKL